MSENCTPDAGCLCQEQRLQFCWATVALGKHRLNWWLWLMSSHRFDWDRCLFKRGWVWVFLCISKMLTVMQHVKTLVFRVKTWDYIIYCIYQQLYFLQFKLSVSTNVFLNSRKKHFSKCAVQHVQYLPHKHCCNIPLLKDMKNVGHLSIHCGHKLCKIYKILFFWPKKVLWNKVMFLQLLCLFI